MPDSFNVPLNIFRNRSWSQTIVLSEDVSPDTFALIVLPVLSGGAAVPVMVVLNPTITFATPNTTITFVAEDGQTGELGCGSAYQWQILWKPLNSPGSTVVAAGPLTVSDSPPFPTESV